MMEKSNALARRFCTAPSDDYIGQIFLPDGPAMWLIGQQLIVLIVSFRTVSCLARML